MGYIRLRSSSHFTTGNKIQAIKDLRTYTYMGLKEAKDAIEGMPCTIEIASHMDTMSIANDLRMHGFDAETLNNEGMGEFEPLLSSSATIERAFKNFIIALVNEGQYDEAVRYLTFRKQDNGGRTLEVV